MAGRIELVRPGGEAEEALVAAIRAVQQGDPLAPVSVVVRAPVVALDLRRRLAARGAFAGVRFLPLNRLAELLAGGESGGGRRPLSRAALGAALRSSLHAAPGIFSQVVEHEATEESLARAYRLARQLSEPERSRVASMSARAHDVLRIVEAARALLEPGWYDREDLSLSAARRLDGDEADLGELGAVLLHLPDPLSPAQLAMLGSLAGRCEVTVLLSHLGEVAADRSSLRLLGQLEGLGYTAPAPVGQAHKPLFDQVIGAPDAEEEVRTALRLLLAHAEGGGVLGRTAIALPASPAGESYVGLVEELFPAAGLPWTGPSRGRLSDSGPGKVVSALLCLLVGDGGSFERAEVVSFLSSPALSARCRLLADLPILSGGEDGRVRAGAIDRCSRAAGVVGGKEEWRVRLGAYGARGPGSVVSGAPAEVARALSRVVGRLGRLADELKWAASWDEVASWAAKVAEEVVLPGEELDRLDDAIAGLALLDGLELLAPAGGPPTATGRTRREAQLLSAFRAVLAGGAGNHGRFGAGPVVGTITALAGLRTDLVLVLGATEGSLPGRSPDDPLFTEIERESVAPLAEQERTEERDRRTLLALLAGAERAVGLYPRVERGAARAAHPSRWLVGDLFEGERDQLASFAAAVRRVSEGSLTPADATDLELAVIERGLASKSRLGDLFVSELGDLGRRLAAEEERRKGRLSRLGGLVGPIGPESELFGEVMSATRVESLARCPLQFMFTRLARVVVLEAPDRRPTIDPLTRGSLIHQILEDFVVATHIEAARPEEWKDSNFTLLREIAGRCFAEVESMGLTGKAIYWKTSKARILADLERFITIERARLRRSGGRPVRTEMAFGFGEDSPPVEIAVAGPDASPPVAMRFRGQIDRIDSEPGGVVRVIDYKSGRASEYGRIASDPLDGGRHLQLPIYAKAAAGLLEGARTVIAEFRFCSSEAGFKQVPVELTPELDTELRRVIGILGGLISRGTFPPRPGKENDLKAANCRRCSYDSICRLDRASLWERARGDKAMADYAELVGEPS